MTAALALSPWGPFWVFWSTIETAPEVLPTRSEA